MKRSGKRISCATSKKISEISDVYPGYQARGALENDPKGTYSLLQGKDLGSNQQISHGELLRLEPIGSTSKYLISPNDVLFQARGYSNHAFHIPEIPDRVLAAATFYILKVRASILQPGYLAWFLNQKHAQNYFKTHANASTAVSYVSKDVLMNLEISIPDLETQAKIQSIQATWTHEKNLMKAYLEKKELLIQESCLNAAMPHIHKEKRR